MNNLQINKLLYIHNQQFSPSDRKGLNTTLLQVFSMCNALSHQGFTVKLFIQGDSNFRKELENFVKSAFCSELLFEVAHYYKKHKNRLLNRVLLRNTIRRITSKENPDIVYTRDPAFLKPILKINKPVIYESHNYKQHIRFHFIHKFLQKEILKSSRNDKFLCLFSISHALSKYWQKLGVENEKLFSWHDGFESSLFLKQLHKNEARKKNKLPVNKKIITYTGGLYPDREIDNIIKLAENFSDCLFLIIGGPEKNRMYYEQRAKKMKIANIIFLGFVNHNKIPTYLFASDVLLALWSSKVPTINYCSPLKLFEYMASGRVILAHNFPTIKEVLTDKEDAIFCEPDNFDSLCLKLMDAIESSKNNVLGIRARNKAFTKYTWKIRAEMLLKFLDNVEENY